MFVYESLEIWQLAVEYAKEIYKITTKFPITERYGLSSQLQRAAVSISANIAEGSGAVGIRDRLNYLDIAIKSALETTSEIQIAFKLGYIDKKTRDDLYESAEKIIRKIRAFKNFLNKR
ncbi:MAG: four helix bundle protein [Candidatus Daviesbacteria bacterium]|nr:four helix bundle protein [Candidatus Daviesbacteria bacterium]